MSVPCCSLLPLRFPPWQTPPGTCHDGTEWWSMRADAPIAVTGTPAGAVPNAPAYPAATPVRIALARSAPLRGPESANWAVSFRFHLKSARARPVALTARFRTENFSREKFSLLRYGTPLLPSRLSRTPGEPPWKFMAAPLSQHQTIRAAPGWARPRFG